jgi:hypothetical protein
VTIFRYRYGNNGKYDLKKVPSTIEGEAAFSKIEMKQDRTSSNPLETQWSVVLSFDTFNAEKCQIGAFFQSSWDESDVNPDSFLKLSPISNDAPNPQFTFSFEVLKTVVGETPVFQHFNKWVVVSCPTFNHLRAESECCVVPYSIQSRYLVLNKKMYPVDFAAPKPKKHLLENFTCDENHTCSPYTFPSRNHRCDVCRQPIPLGCQGLRCKQCDYDVCNNCKEKRCEGAETKKTSRCSNGHSCYPHIFSRQFCCDVCGENMPLGCPGLKCKQCNYDICSNCKSHHDFDHKLCVCQLVKCKSGHVCDPKQFRCDVLCDKCGETISEDSWGYRCSQCYFDVCDRCASLALSVSPKLHLRACFDQSCFECKSPAPMFSYFCDECSSCIPPQCVFMTSNPGPLKHYPISIPLEAGSIQRYRVVEIAAFETFDVGSEVMITVPKTTVFESSEVLKVVRAEHTQDGPHFIVRVADEEDRNIVNDDNLLGCTRMERLPISKIQRVTNGTLDEKGGVFVKGSKFTQFFVDPAFIPPWYVGTVIQEADMKSWFLEWPLTDCLHNFKMSRPRLLLNTAQPSGSEKQAKAKRQFLLEDLRNMIDKKEHFFVEKKDIVPFFDVLFVGSECHVYEGESAKPKLLTWDIPYFTVIRCAGARAQNANFPIAPHAHQICSAVSDLIIKTSQPQTAEAGSSMNRVKKTGQQQKESQATKQTKHVFFGLKLQVDVKGEDAGKKVDVKGDMTSQDAGKNLESVFLSDNMDKNFLFEKETPLSLKLTGEAFTLISVDVQSCTEDDPTSRQTSSSLMLQADAGAGLGAKVGSGVGEMQRSIEETVAKEDQVPRSALHHHSIKKKRGKIVVDELVDEFDVYIEFCRELGEYFQVKRFIIKHKVTKYTIGLIFDVNGNWVEVHRPDPCNNENELECFVQHPLSKIIDRNYLSYIIFTVIAVQGKDQNNFFTQVKDWIEKQKWKKNVSCQKEGFEKKEPLKKESEQQESASVLVFFSSLEDAKQFKIEMSKPSETICQIKKVTVDRKSYDGPWALPPTRLFFVNLLKKKSSRTRLFSHQTELEYENREAGAVVPQLEYSASLMPNCKFKLQVAKFQRYMHPIAPGVPHLLERNTYFIFYENFKESGKIQYGKWKYAEVISSSESRVDGHVVIQEIDVHNQRGPLRALKLWLVECKNPNCSSNPTLDCTFFHFSKHGSGPTSQWIDDYCPKLQQCDIVNCGLNHQKPRKVVATVLSFQILSKPLIFPSSKSNVVFLKPNLHHNSEHFLKGFLRPWLPGRVVGIDIGKQVYKVKPIVDLKSLPNTKKVFSCWANAKMFAAFCENKIEVHFSSSSDKKIELPNPWWCEVRSCAWISFEKDCVSLAYGCGDGKIYIHTTDLKHLGKQVLLKGHLGAVTCISPIMSANMAKDLFKILPSFASGSADGDIRLWSKIGTSWQSQVFHINAFCFFKY